MKRSITKTNKNTSSRAKTKEPVLSTGKKIGLTVYFTFIFTLMGIMGLQIWMNSMNSNIDSNSLSTPQVTQNAETTPNNNLPYNNTPDTTTYPDVQENNSNYPATVPTTMNENVQQNTTELNSDDLNTQYR